MTPLSGSTGVVEFRCGIRVSRCCWGTVTRICTTGKPDVFRCESCGNQSIRNAMKDRTQ